MPTWTTHTEGGSWSGGGHDVPNCDVTQRTNIENAFNNFINSSCFDCVPDLRACLRGKFASIGIDCPDPAGGSCAGLDGFQSGGTLSLCNTTPARIPALMFHELTHACDGRELDAEAVEQLCFNGNGATLPFGDDWDKFRSETDALDGNVIERVGRWFIWNSNTGQVWAKSSEGGDWHSSARVIKGPQCFQSDSWIHAYPAAGGGWI